MINLVIAKRLVAIAKAIATSDLGDDLFSDIDLPSEEEFTKPLDVRTLQQNPSPQVKKPAVVEAPKPVLPPISKEERKKKEMLNHFFDLGILPKADSDRGKMVNKYVDDAEYYIANPEIPMIFMGTDDLKAVEKAFDNLDASYVGWHFSIVPYWDLKDKVDPNNETIWLHENDKSPKFFVHTKESPHKKLSNERVSLPTIFYGKDDIAYKWYVCFTSGVKNIELIVSGHFDRTDAVDFTKTTTFLSVRRHFPKFNVQVLSRDELKRANVDPAKRGDKWLTYKDAAEFLKEQESPNVYKMRRDALEEKKKELRMTTLLKKKF